MYMKSIVGCSNLLNENSKSECRTIESELKSLILYPPSVGKKYEFLEYPDNGNISKSNVWKHVEQKRRDTESLTNKQQKSRKSN